MLFGMPHARNLRKGRWSAKGQVYLITFVTKDRRPIFQEFRLARALICCINTSPHVSTLAFVVMPDHVHWLICLDGDAPLSKAIKSAKAISARRINRLRKSSGQTWQPGFHDYAIRREEDIRGVARYIVANPIRSKLVRSVREYPHWDAIWI